MFLAIGFSWCLPEYSCRRPWYMTSPLQVGGAGGDGPVATGAWATTLPSFCGAGCEPADVGGCGGACVCWKGPRRSICCCSSQRPISADLVSCSGSGGSYESPAFDLRISASGTGPMLPGFPICCVCGGAGAAFMEGGKLGIREWIASCECLGKG